MPGALFGTPSVTCFANATSLKEGSLGFVQIVNLLI